MHSTGTNYSPTLMHQIMTDLSNFATTIISSCFKITTCNTDSLKLISMHVQRDLSIPCLYVFEDFLPSINIKVGHYWPASETSSNVPRHVISNNVAF